MTSFKSVREALQNRGSEAFLLDENGQELSGNDVLSHAHVLAHFLAQQGVLPGARVAFALRNGPETASIILALMAAGYVAVAINLQAGDRAIAHALKHSEAKAVIAQDSTMPVVKKLTAAPCFHRALVLEPQSAASQVALADVEPDDIALLMYTSGTTGLPKGVQLSHRAMIAGGQNTAQAHELTQQDRALCVLPLYHINGLCVTLMAPLVSGGSVFLPPKFSVGAFWQQIRDLSCTWFSVVPTQISYLLHHPDPVEPIPSLRFGRSASAPLAPDVQRAFERRFEVAVIETMGMTETAAQLLSNPLPPGTRKVGSPGRAFGNEVMIADDQQQELPRGVEGEVLIRGDNVMTGYLDNPEATAAALTADGWLRSGDLGRMDEDGYVFITGRLKELIIKGGENIAPREVDEALYSNPSVIEAAAFAVPCPQYGERVEAAVVLKAKATCDEEELLQLCRGILGLFKAPTRIHFMDELPKGPSGKIQRLKLQELVVREGTA
ncbi:MAG: AMP-binding protein [Alphaproteobacteria bacterium]